MATDRCDGERLMRLLSAYLNLSADAVGAADVETLSRECCVSRETAYALLLTANMGLDVARNSADRALYETYFDGMLKMLDVAEYYADPYIEALGYPEGRLGAWELKRLCYKPYELFVRDDIRMLESGLFAPQLGYFAESFYYPAALESGREWMTVTPNEVNTMKRPVEASRGAVLTYGLGLGYFAFMAARREAVASVTVVERDPVVISLFKKAILPRFPRACAGKLNIVQADAFEYAKSVAPRISYDFIFTDIWHDALDGVELYKRMKALEPLSPGARHEYWIEETLKRYI